MDLLWPQQGAFYDTSVTKARKNLKPLQDQVRVQGLWARHLGPELGGSGYGQFKLALMTEPQGGADPTQFTCLATRDGDGWVIDGEKWFSSNARLATFLIVIAVTNSNATPHERM
jgi:hypothetical protein